MTLRLVPALTQLDVLDGGGGTAAAATSDTSAAALEEGGAPIGFAAATDPAAGPAGLATVVGVSVSPPSIAPGAAIGADEAAALATEAYDRCDCCGSGPFASHGFDDSTLVLELMGAALVVQPDCTRRIYIYYRYELVDSTLLTRENRE